MAVAGDEPHVGDRSSLPFGRIVGELHIGSDQSFSECSGASERTPLGVTCSSKFCGDNRRIRTTSGERSETFSQDREHRRPSCTE